MKRFLQLASSRCVIRVVLVSWLGMLLAGCAHIEPEAFTFVQMCDPQFGFGGASSLEKFGPVACNCPLWF